MFSYFIVASLIIDLAVLAESLSSTSKKPCDLCAAARLPCVASHSTTRSLHGSYNSSLYQIRRGSDNATAEIFPLEPGGIANASMQDVFCRPPVCIITMAPLSCLAHENRGEIPPTLSAVWL